MLFNSIFFIFIFLPIVWFGYFLIQKSRFSSWTLLYLLISSIAFYTCGDGVYVFLLLGSILMNYGWAYIIKRSCKNSLLLLFCALGINLSILGYYKYYSFFIGHIDFFFKTSFIGEEHFLPLGISFYTFTQIIYLIDIYKNKSKNHSFLNYSSFVLFFPQLLAGPILRHDDLIPQFKKKKFLFPQRRKIEKGIALFILGLSKKVLIADTFAPWVKNTFTNIEGNQVLDVWGGAICFLLQLYYDFSGYSDMAVGLGWLFGLDLPINFNSPYKSLSVSDFWRRWHITLSHAFRDYLYIPLGGARQNLIRLFFSLMTTMLLAGLWHGNNLTFLVWGGLHGLFLLINHIWRKFQISLPLLVKWPLTFSCLAIAIIFFRGENLADSLRLITIMVGLKGVVLPSNLNFIVSFKFLFTSLIMTMTLLCQNTNEMMKRFLPTFKWGMMLSILLVFCFTLMNKTSEFIYFRF